MSTSNDMSNLAGDSKPIKYTAMNRKGVTLIELIVVVALLFVLIVAVSTFIRPMRGLFALNTDMVNYKEESKVVLELIEKKLRTTKYLSVYDYISESFPDEVHAGKTNSYLYGFDGKIWYHKEGEPKREFIDSFVFDGKKVLLSAKIPGIDNGLPGKPNVSTIVIGLAIVDRDGIVVYETSTGFELVNMVLNEARLFDLSSNAAQFDPLIVFLEEGE